MKLPASHYASNAVHFSGIGKQLLKKHGWREGNGLGVQQQGMAEFVKPSYKFDSSGVGASSAAVFSWADRWWERLFDSAAKAVASSVPSQSDVSTASSPQKQKRKRSSGASTEGRVVSQEDDEATEAIAEAKEEKKKQKKRKHQKTVDLPTPAKNISQEAASDNAQQHDAATSGIGTERARTKSEKRSKRRKRHLIKNDCVAAAVHSVPESYNHERKEHKAHGNCDTGSIAAETKAERKARKRAKREARKAARKQQEEGDGNYSVQSQNVVEPKTTSVKPAERVAEWWESRFVRAQQLTHGETIESKRLQKQHTAIFSEADQQALAEQQTQASRDRGRGAGLGIKRGSE